MANDYFNRPSSKWNLHDFCHHFLTTAPESHRTLNALTSVWTNSLKVIRRDENSKESRRARKAEVLRHEWDQVPGQRKIARAAVDTYRVKPSVVNNSTFLGEVGTVFSGSVGVVDMGGTDKGIHPESSPGKRPPSPSPLPTSDTASSRTKKQKKDKKPAANTSITEWRQRFLDMYGSMTPSKKMKLSTGTIVEDVIFSYGWKLGKQSLVHSFIIDAENQVLSRQFSKDEWAEILAVLDARRKALADIEMPMPLQWVPDSVTTTQALRKILFAPEQPQGADEEWIADVYRQFLFLLEHPDKPLTRSQCENWFEVTLLGRLVNRCIMTLPSVEVLCKEATSVATRGHLNQHRTQTGQGNHLLPSPRLDSIFRLIQPGYEFGGCEVGKHDRGPEDTKRIEDFNKLSTTLSHMLRRLHAEVKVSKPEKLEVVGLLCSGLTIEPLRMHSVNGYTCFLLRGGTLRIPANERRIRDVRKLLKAMWLVKKTISDTVDLLWSVGDEEDEVGFEEEVKEEESEDWTEEMGGAEEEDDGETEDEEEL